MLAKGPQVGDIVKDGKSVCKQFEWYCMRHPKPTKMLKSIAESIEKQDNYKSAESFEKVEKKLVISGAHCQRCGQYIEEGKWYED